MPSQLKTSSIMSSAQAISAFSDFMSSGRFDGFTTSLQSLAILSGLVIPPLFVFAMLRGISPNAIRIFAVYVLVIAMLYFVVVRARFSGDVVRPALWP